MKNKIKLIIPVLALGLIVSSVAFAQSPVGTGNTNTTTTTTKKECLANAKTARTSAIKAANDIAKQSKLDAKTTKDAALKDAKANTDKKARALAIKTANTAYKTAIKDANTTQKASLKTAQSDYTIAVKACPKK